MERTAALLCVFAILAAPALAAQQDSLLQRLSALQTKRQNELQTSNKLAVSLPDILVIVECGTDSLEQLVALAGGLVKESETIAVGVTQLIANAATCAANNANDVFALIECELDVVESGLKGLRSLEDKVGDVIVDLRDVLKSFKTCVAAGSSA